MVYVVLLRGINVGGKNKVPMADLKVCIEQLGCTNVRTYIASGNVIVESDRTAEQLRQEIQTALHKKFELDSMLIEILVLSKAQLKSVIDNAPKGFGAEPAKYHTDVIFLIDISSDEAFKVFKLREGVDKVWQGELVIYSQRLSPERTKSRLSAIMASPLYKKMTIRTWKTATKLMAMM